MRPKGSPIFKKRIVGKLPGGWMGDQAREPQV